MTTRRARFVCVAAAVLLPTVADGNAGLSPAAAVRTSPATPGRSLVGSMTGLREYVATGEWWGTITTEPHGDGGFGYDPVFLPKGSGLTVAQLSQEVKDQASHRALAGRALLKLLQREGLLD